MEITRNYLTNGYETMQKRLLNGYYKSDEQIEGDCGWNRAENFAINIESLKQKYKEIKPFCGNVYNGEGQKPKYMKTTRKTIFPHYGL